MANLKGKQALFVEEYLKDRNGTRAAIAAGYSENTAAEMAYENLRKPQIMEAIASRNAKIMEKHEITQDRVLTELASLAFGKVKKDGVLRNDHKLKALELMSKHLGILDGTGGSKGDNSSARERLNNAVRILRERRKPSEGGGDS